MPVAAAPGSNPNDRVQAHCSRPHGHDDPQLFDHEAQTRWQPHLHRSSAAGTCPTGTGSGTAKFSTVLKSGATGAPVYTVSPAVFGIH